MIVLPWPFIILIVCESAAAPPPSRFEVAGGGGGACGEEAGPTGGRRVNEGDREVGEVEDGGGGGRVQRPALNVTKGSCTQSNPPANLSGRTNLVEEKAPCYSSSSTAPILKSFLFLFLGSFLKTGLHIASITFSDVQTSKQGSLHQDPHLPDKAICIVCRRILKHHLSFVPPGV